MSARGSSKPRRRRTARFPGKAASRRQLAAAVTTSAPALAEILGAFFVRAGLKPAQVADVFREMAKIALQRPLQLEPRVSQLWWQVSDAVSVWWSDPEYLDDAGRPRALPEFGPAPSIDALLSRSMDAAEVEDAKQLLRRTAVSVVKGRWRFEEENPFIRLAGDAGVERLLMTWSGMLGTFLDNQVRRRDPPSRKNFDRSAHVIACPIGSIPKLRAKFLKRMQVMLQELHDTLAAEERRGTRGPVAAVGVTMFMHTSSARRPPSTRADRKSSAKRGHSVPRRGRRS